jgi:endosialidase-like protein
MRARVLLLLPLTVLVVADRLLAQDTVFTYQGRVTGNGTNFTGAGEFKFALVTSTNLNHQATAIANPPIGGFITTINVTYGGNGYTAPPIVTIAGGGGSGAGATATISGGMVTGITVTNPGSAYTSTPTVTVAPPPANISYTTWWSNDGTSVNGGEPAGAVGVGVANGLFTVVLGDTTLANMTAISASLFVQPDLQLRIWFNDGVNGSVALSPVQNLTPAPYAIFAQIANLPGLTVQPNTNGAPNLIGGSAANVVSNGVVGATIGGGGATNYFGSAYTNSVTADFGTVGGGWVNTASGDSATVGGGGGNAAAGFSTTVGGGAGNSASGAYAAVGGGRINTASGVYAVVGGGFVNTASGDSATVGGGAANTASGPSATVAGGYANSANTNSATVPGGYFNVASGQYSLAAGQQAQALHQGAFVWADSQNAPFASQANDQFLIRAQGGVGINLNNPTDAALSVAGRVRMNDNNIYFRSGTDPFHGLGFFGNGSLNGDFAGVNVNGPVLWGNGGGALGTLNNTQAVSLLWTATSVTVNGTFNNNSDRNAKEHFTAVSSKEVLDKVATLPLNEWSYKTDAATRHLGPTAQDFYSAFNLGTDNKHIAPMDEGGVALAAIQALNQKLNENDAEIKRLKQRADEVDSLEKQIDSLTARLNELEAMVKALAEKK